MRNEWEHFSRPRKAEELLQPFLDTERPAEEMESYKRSHVMRIFRFILSTTKGFNALSKKKKTQKTQFFVNYLLLQHLADCH